MSVYRIKGHLIEIFYDVDSNGETCGAMLDGKIVVLYAPDAYVALATVRLMLG
jgi:hypothetical protein